MKAEIHQELAMLHTKKAVDIAKYSATIERGCNRNRFKRKANRNAFYAVRKTANELITT